MQQDLFKLSSLGCVLLIGVKIFQIGLILELLELLFMIDSKCTILLSATGDVYLMKLLLIANHQNHKYGNATKL